MIVEFVFITFFLAYLIYIIIILVGWKETGKEADTSDADKFPITVIVPVRNEAENIRNLLQDLDHQNYGVDNFDVLVVDDHSEDATTLIVEEMCGRVNYRLRLTKLALETGKKAAITWGIENSKNEPLIVTTDADCRLGPGWLKQITEKFRNKDLDLIFGPVTIANTNGVFSAMQQIEFSILQVTGASTLALGYPTMCNGANMAYKKSVFNEVNGFNQNMHIASGDDEFLMHKVFKRKPRSVGFLKSRGSIVETKPLVSLRTFINQRRRWASKWEGYESVSSKVLAVFITLVQLLFLTLISLILLEMVNPIIGIALISIKVVSEMFLWLSAANFFKQNVNPHIFILMAFGYPFYVLFFAVVGRFGKYSWKGRRLN